MTFLNIFPKFWGKLFPCGIILSCSSRHQDDSSRKPCNHHQLSIHGLNLKHPINILLFKCHHFSSHAPRRIGHLPTLLQADTFPFRFLTITCFIGIKTRKFVFHHGFENNECSVADQMASVRLTKVHWFFRRRFRHSYTVLKKFVCRREYVIRFSSSSSSFLEEPNEI